MSTILANYIRAEMVTAVGRDSILEKELEKVSLALAKAIQRYLTTDVKTIELGLQVDPTTLSIGTTTSVDGTVTGQLDPNPHSHSINPHRHDITAP